MIEVLLRIADFVVDTVGVVDVSDTEIVPSPPNEHLTFSGVTYTPNKIVSSLFAAKPSGSHSHLVNINETSLVVRLLWSIILLHRQTPN